MELLNGEQGADYIRALKIVFLACLAVAALAVLFAPSIKPGKTSYGLLRGLVAFSLAGVLAYQATWQIGGFARPPFARFLRRYNKRPNAAALQVARGPILDRRGLVLAAPVPGDIWGRRYPLGEAAAHPIGYYHSRYGITAVERVFDDELSGCGAESAPAKGLFKPRAEEGATVLLNLDSRLQAKAYELLDGRKGAVVVLRPRSGALLALVSSPGFDPLRPEAAARDEENAPVFNRAVQGRYPPGSTFKILIAGAALAKGLSPSYPCPAMGYVAGRDTPPIRDNEYYAYKRKGAEWPGWGRLTMREAMAHSSNVYFAQLGVACGPETFNEIAALARINEPLVYLAAPSAELKTAKGNAPAVPKNRKGALAMLAIGQGEVLVTPLHVACYTAAAAADGALMRPRLGLREPVEKLADLFTPQAAAQLRTMLRDAVALGTGKAANVPGLEVCGKTGTAQAPQGDDHAWFTCFAPYRHPNIVVTVLVENGGFGAAAALPVARELLEEADRLGYVRRPEEGFP